MNWQRKLAEFLVPSVFKEVRKLNQDNHSLNQRLAALRYEIEKSKKSRKKCTNKLDDLKAKIEDLEDEPRPTMLGGIEYESEPTQKDKPSPASSLSRDRAIRLATEMAARMHEARISRVADTNSMEPWIDDNCIIVLERLDEENHNAQPIRIGQILTYDGNGSKWKNFHGLTIMHRVVDMDGDHLLFRGDNNFNEDGWIHRKYVEERLVGQFWYQQNEKGD